MKDLQGALQVLDELTTGLHLGFARVLARPTKGRYPATRRDSQTRGGIPDAGTDIGIVGRMVAQLAEGRPIGLPRAALERRRCIRRLRRATSED